MGFLLVFKVTKPVCRFLAFGARLASCAGRRSLLGFLSSWASMAWTPVDRDGLDPYGPLWSRSPVTAWIPGFLDSYSLDPYGPCALPPYGTLWLGPPWTPWLGPLWTSMDTVWVSPYKFLFGFR